MSDNIKIAIVSAVVILVVLIVVWDSRKGKNDKDTATDTKSTPSCEVISTVEFERLKQQKRDELYNKWIADLNGSNRQFVLDKITEYMPYAIADGVDVNTNGSVVVIDYAAWAEAYFYLINEGYCDPQK